MDPPFLYKELLGIDWMRYVLPQTKFGKRYCFETCLSFCSQAGVCILACTLAGGVVSQRAPGRGGIQGLCMGADVKMGDVDNGTVHTPKDGHRSGRYA